MKLPVVSGKEVIRVLKKLGFSIDRQKGSHVQMVKIIEGEERLVTVPIHSNKKLIPFVFKSIAKQAGYSTKEFADFFR